MLEVMKTTLNIYQNYGGDSMMTLLVMAAILYLWVSEERREVKQAESEYTIILQNFADAMEGREEPLATIADGRRALENCNAAYLSDWRQKKTEIPCDAAAYDRELQKKIPEEL